MKKESSVKELIKLEQDFELRVSKEEMNYMGCPKTDHFETCLDDMLKSLDGNNVKLETETRENVMEKTNEEIGFLLKEMMKEVYFSNQIYIKIIIFEIVIMLICFATTFSSIIAYEYNFPILVDDINFSFFLTDNSKGILLATYVNNTALTVVLLFTVYLRYWANIQFDIYNKVIDPDEDLYSTKLYYQMIFEMFLLLPHPNVFLINYNFIYVYSSDKNYRLKYEANDFMIVFMMVRIFYLIRFIFVMSYYKSSRSSRICKIFGENSSEIFALRSLFNKYPFKFFIALFCTVICSFAFAIRVFERIFVSPLNLDFVPDKIDFNPFANALWFAMVTTITSIIVFTLVGYGDFTPRTYMGRTMTVVLVFFGIVTCSLLTVVFFRSLEFTPNENKVYMLLERLKLRQQITIIEREISQRAFENFRLAWKIRKQKSDENTIDAYDKIKKTNSKQMTYLFRKKSYLKKKIQNISSFNYQMENILDEISNILTNLNHNVKMLNSLSEKLNEINSTETVMIKNVRINVETSRKRMNNTYLIEEVKRKETIRSKKK